MAREVNGRRVKPEVSFYLKPGEPLPEGIGRAVREQLRAASFALMPEGDLHKGIHEARKGLKRSRSLLRLVRPVLGNAYNEANSAMRNFARTLSPVRDAAALAEMVDRMGSEEMNAATESAVQQAAKALHQRQAEATESLLQSTDKGHAAKALEEVIDRLGSLPMAHVDRRVVLAGVTTTLKRGRKDLKRAREQPEPESFHDWRKRAKDLRYQLNFLGKLWPEVIEGYAAAAEKLEQTLGEDHNLAVLSGTLRNLELEEKGTTAMASLIETRQIELRASALKLGALLYQDSPKQWRRRLKLCWQTSH